ncbi:MAG: serine--tRNA ligase [Alphaproteobacteria bacterium]|nr:serine--tRNA ligase [Alphaproteobacteria bacterium]MBN2779563.1 serine--tRNA ligase [Alphaproteobacteria bacterium]
MLDKNYILENVEKIETSAKNKGFKVDLKKIITLGDEIAALKTEHQKHLAEKNQLSKSIQNASADERPAMIEKSKKAGENAKKIELDLETKEVEYTELMLHVPQVHFDDAPIGKDDTGNVVTKTVGEKTKFDFEPKDHYTLLEENDWANFNISEITGPRAYSLKGNAARLELAIHQFVLDKLMDKGFTMMTVPALCKPQAILDAGHFPGSDIGALESDVYFLTGTDLCLAGTSEIVLNSLHRGEILEENQLPKLYAGYSPCYRKEAGAAGKDTRGLVRVHQFSKVEQFVYCKPEESQKYFDKLLTTLEEIMMDLELSYQLLEACTGDMGFNKMRMIDVEAWVPTQNKYRELGSCSMIGDFQARRTNTRYRANADGKVHYTHTLNNTGIATPRVLVPLLENHQTKDGDVKIPTKLQPYMHGLKTLKA